jgi:AcrR family transcriptional regulator
MARQATKRPPSADRILEAALRVIASAGWRRLTMAAIAAESGATLLQVREAFPDRAAILTGFIRRTDAAVLSGHDPSDAGEPVRERLLDVLLRRFDALRPHKDAVRSIVRESLCDPGFLCALPAFGRAMAWSLEAAGVSSAGPLGILRVKAVAAIYLSALRVWLRDDSEDLGPTTAHLDRSLKRAEALAMRLPGSPRPRSA